MWMQNYSSRLRIYASSSVYTSNRNLGCERRNNTSLNKVLVEAIVCGEFWVE